MKVFNVEILSHDEEINTFKVRYCINNGTGVIRRSMATYFDGHLSRDNDKPQLIEIVEKLIKKERR